MEDPNEERWGNVLLLYVPSTTIAARKVYPHCKGANIYMTTPIFLLLRIHFVVILQTTKLL